MNKSLRTFLVVVFGILLIILAFFLSISFLFSGRAIYVLPMLITILVFIAFVFSRFVKQVKNKQLNIITAACFIVLFGVVLYKEIPIIYANYVGKIEGEINLREYAPFITDTKAVYLNEPSSLKFNDSLPRLDGATALYPVYSAFSQAVYPNEEYSYWDSAVRCSKTGEAYKNLFNNEVDIIFAAQPSKEHREYAKAQGLTLELVPIGYEAFVFFVNEHNPIENLSIKQIKGIYSGQITNWKQVSSKKGKIIAFQRPANSGSQTMLEKVMGSHPIMEPRREDVVDGMGGIIQRAAEYTNYKNAIGYSFLFYTTKMVSNNKIRILKVEGIEPNKESIKNRSYPFSGAFYAITVKEHKSNKNVDLLIQWILSHQGQKIIEKTGYVPL